MSANQVTITGSTVTGPVAGGDVTVRGPRGGASERPDQADREPGWGEVPGIKAGLAIDVVGYSSRTRFVQDMLLGQLAALGERLRAQVGRDSFVQTTGDGFNLVYSPEGPWLRTAETVLDEVGRWVDEIGTELSTPLRVRVVLGVGDAHLHTGAISGSLVVELTRVLNSPELRSAGDRIDDGRVLYAALAGAGTEQICTSRTANRSTSVPRAMECAGYRAVVGVL